MKPPPLNKRKVEPILLVEAVGFLVVIAACWGAAFLDLPHYFFGEAAGFDWGRALLRSAVILPVWGWVHFSTRHLLKRLRYLEEFLLVCAWCRKVGNEGEWLTMEEYFGSRYAESTSHGICPECLEKVVAQEAQKRS